MNEPRVEIDDRIREDESLYSAVEAASDVYREAAAKPPEIVPSHGVLRWKVGEYRAFGPRILREYVEPNGDGRTHRVLRTEFFPSALLDPVSRDVSMYRLLHDITRWRMEEVDERIRQHLQLNDAEGENGLAS